MRNVSSLRYKAAVMERNHEATCSSFWSGFSRPVIRSNGPNSELNCKRAYASGFKILHNQSYLGGISQRKGIPKGKKKKKENILRREFSLEPSKSAVNKQSVPGQHIGAVEPQ